MDLDRDGFIDEGWSQVKDADENTFNAGDALPDLAVVEAVTPNGLRLTDQFDFAVYLKGDQPDSAKIYNAQLVLEYGADPNEVVLYDYGDAPDNGSTYSYQYFEGKQAARAKILEDFTLGTSPGGDIDADGGPLYDPYNLALGDDLLAIDDEGNGVSFPGPLRAGKKAKVDVEISLPDTLTNGYLHAWIDFGADGVWDSEDQILDGVTVCEGSNRIDFTVPVFSLQDLPDQSVFARFILSDQEDVDPYRAATVNIDSEFYGEVEDYKIKLTRRNSNASEKSKGNSDRTGQGTVVTFPEIIDAPPPPPVPEDDKGGDGEDGKPVPPDPHQFAPLLDRNAAGVYSASVTFSTDDVIGKFDGSTQGDLPDGQNTSPPTSIINFDFPGDPLYPINSEFGFNVTDFVGAEAKDFILDPEYEEGWAGNLVVPENPRNAARVSRFPMLPTPHSRTPFRLGTWLVGMGGDSVKASTEHYSVMQQVLSDQRYPEDPEALVELDDDLIVIGGDYGGKRVIDLVESRES